MKEFEKKIAEYEERNEKMCAKLLPILDGLTYGEALACFAYCIEKLEKEQRNELIKVNNIFHPA